MEFRRAIATLGRTCGIQEQAAIHDTQPTTPFIIFCQRWALQADEDRFLSHQGYKNGRETGSDFNTDRSSLSSNSTLKILKLINWLFACPQVTTIDQLQRKCIVFHQFDDTSYKPKICRQTDL